MEPLTTTSNAPDNLETEATETSAETPRVFNLREVLDVDAIQALRAEQQQSYDLVQTFYADNPDDDKRNSVADESVEQANEKYLLQHGLKKEDESFLLYKAVLSNLSIKSIPEDKWWAVLAEGSTDEHPVTGQSGRDKTRAYYQQLTGKSYYEDENIAAAEAEDNETDEANTAADHFIINGEKVYGSLEVHRGKLEHLRKKLAVLSAERQGRMFVKGKKYEEALALYNDQVILLGKIEHQSLIDDDEATETVKKATIVGYLFKEQEKLREAALKNLQDTYVSWFVEKMNSGTKMQRFGKGVVLGLGAAGAGALLGAAAGAAGIAAIGAAGAVGTITAVRFARGFAASDGKSGRGMQKMETKHLETAQNAGYGDDGEVDYVNAIQTYFNKQLERDTEQEQKKRRHSVRVGMAGVALGALGVGAIATLSDNGVFDSASDHIGHIINGPSEASPANIDGNPIPKEGESIVPYGGDYNNQYPDNNRDGIYTDADRPTSELSINAEAEATAETSTEAAHEAAIEAAGEPAETPIGTEAAVDPNFVVDELGEGGIHFFQDMGLTEANWKSIQFDLLKEFDGEFYRMLDGNVGLKHTGPLSKEAQEFIKDKFALAA